MSPWRWFGALWQRILLFLLAGITAVAVLHSQAGLVLATPNVPRSSFSVPRWIEATREYLTHVVRGDLGVLPPLRVTGYNQAIEVTELLWTHGSKSALLLALALLVSLFVGTFAGLLTSRFGARWFRTPALSATLFLLSTPDILIILLLRGLVAWALSAFGLKLFSLSALGASLTPSHFIAPVLALSALPLALVARVSAVAFDEVYEQLYIRTAVAKGLNPLGVLFGHALKNAWIRVAESGPLIMSTLVTGLVIVEYVLYFPGIGRTLGLILERSADPFRSFYQSGGVMAHRFHSASAGIALALLLGALLIEISFAAIRMALDPRLAEQQAAAGRLAGSGWLDGLRALPATLVAWPRSVAGWLADLPERLRQAFWTWRPRQVLRAIWQNPPLLIGLVGVGALAFVALFGGQFADLGAAHRAPRYVVKEGEVFFPPFVPGLPGFPLGSDMLGRDLLTRLLIGARYTLFFTLAVTPVRFLIALPWGLLAGLRGGLSAGAGRTLGLIFSAVPVILIPAALLPIRTVLGKDPGSGEGFWLIVAILAVVGIPRLVESVRQNVEAIAVQPFVEGARAVGASSGRILRRHIFPHLIPQLWVTAAADMAWTLLLLAQFGVFSLYLGGTVFATTGFELLTGSAGIMVPRVPDWSSMLSRPYEVIYRAPWSLWFPALAFLLAIVAFNLLAEGLRRRAQHMAPSLAPAAEEQSPAARRHLALEWGVALVILLAAGGLTLRYGFQSQPAYATTRLQTPLEMSRLQLQAMIETAQGTGSDLERSKAIASLPRAGMEYLTEAHNVGLTSGEIQADSQGRLTLLDLDDFRLASLYIPDTPTGLNSYHFLQDKATGLVSYAISVERPTSFAVLRDEGSAPHTLLIAGTVPGPDTWIVSVWGYPRGNGAWTRSGLAETLHQALPADMEARLVIEDSTASSRVEQTLGPLANTKVAPNGDVTFCRGMNTDCVTIPLGAR